jgi:hypothetical protein
MMAHMMAVRPTRPSHPIEHHPIEQNRIRSPTIHPT